MKKILILLTSIGLVVSSSTVVVACNGVKEKDADSLKYKNVVIFNKLKSSYDISFNNKNEISSNEYKDFNIKDVNNITRKNNTNNKITISKNKLSIKGHKEGIYYYLLSGRDKKTHEFHNIGLFTIKIIKKDNVLKEEIRDLIKESKILLNKNKISNENSQFYIELKNTVDNNEALLETLNYHDLYNLYIELKTNKATFIQSLTEPNAGMKFKVNTIFKANENINVQYNKITGEISSNDYYNFSIQYNRNDTTLPIMGINQLNELEITIRDSSYIGAQSFNLIGTKILDGEKENTVIGTFNITIAKIQND